MAGMEMGDMQMDEMEMECAVEISENAIGEDQPVQIGTASSTKQNAIDFPTEPCGHCWMHSQPASGAVTLVAVDPSKQSIDTNAPTAGLTITLPIAFIVSITPLEHGPPGNVLPRHVLINVFRI